MTALNKPPNPTTNQSATQSAAVQKPPIDQLFASLQHREDLSKLTVSGGCFWCMEGPFEAEEGVEEVISGYAGGQVNNPTYEQVIAGNTGHREAVQIYFKPDQISVQQLLEIYFRQIDPTDEGGQFADRGFQYTTAIFYRDHDQQQTAQNYINQLGQSNRYDKPIVTEVVEFTSFYPAEEYHQDYYLHSADRYNRYKQGSGRADYIKQNSPE